MATQNFWKLVPDCRFMLELFFQFWSFVYLSVDIRVAGLDKLCLRAVKTGAFVSAMLCLLITGLSLKLHSIMHSCGYPNQIYFFICAQVLEVIYGMLFSRGHQ